MERFLRTSAQVETKWRPAFKIISIIRIKKRLFFYAHILLKIGLWVAPLSVACLWRQGTVCTIF